MIAASSTENDNQMQQDSFNCRRVRREAVLLEVFRRDVADNDQRSLRLTRVNRAIAPRDTDCRQQQSKGDAAISIRTRSPSP